MTRLPSVKTSKRNSIFWKSISPVDKSVTLAVVDTTQVDEHTVRETLAYPEGTELQGEGNLKLNLMFYQPRGIDLAAQSKSSLNALGLVPKIVMPFLVMIVASLLTRKNSEEALDRYYAKMKTPVDPDPEADARKLEAAYADPSTCERVKLLPGISPGIPEADHRGRRGLHHLGGRLFCDHRYRCPDGRYRQLRIPKDPHVTQRHQHRDLLGRVATPRGARPAHGP
ncbi:MAG: hypothetical protein Ct9H300mP1_26640 [Planctomycetaceae bacterium]|nr:MAG: hypothetical protein Ct9H300mP1_26640 [Planctomycetaceae bacterium]